MKNSWKVYKCFVIDQENETVCMVEDNKKSESDLNLISAAPELLEALQSIIQGYENRSNSGMFDMLCHGDEIEKANAAIAKALGEK